MTTCTDAYEGMVCCRDDDHEVHEDAASGRTWWSTEDPGETYDHEFSEACYDEDPESVDSGTEA